MFGARDAFAAWSSAATAVSPTGSGETMVSKFLCDFRWFLLLAAAVALIHIQVIPWSRFSRDLEFLRFCVTDPRAYVLAAAFVWFCRFLLFASFLNAISRVKQKTDANKWNKSCFVCWIFSLLMLMDWKCGRIQLHLYLSLCILTRDSVPFARACISRWTKVIYKIMRDRRTKASFLTCKRSVRCRTNEKGLIALDCLLLVKM